jgi:hypothetical protein
MVQIHGNLVDIWYERNISPVQEKLTLILQASTLLTENRLS